MEGLLSPHTEPAPLLHAFPPRLPHHPQASARAEELEVELEARDAELAAAAGKLAQTEKLLAQMEGLHLKVGG